MNEEQWLDSKDPQAMLTFLEDSGRVSERKLRLLATACGRSLWPLLEDPRSKKALAVAEDFADGRASDEQRSEAYGDAVDAVRESGRGQSLKWRFATSSFQAQFTAAAATDSCPRVFWSRMPLEGHMRVALLRCLFPNPFRPPPPIPASVLQWNEGLVRQLAAAAYEHRLLPSGQLDPERLGVLADALEEAGANGELVEHLRGPGSHWRGCWAVDSILGKE